MKHIFTFLLLAFTTISFAQKANLIVFNNSGDAFFLIVNGIRQNEEPRTNIRINDLQPGSFELKIIFANGKTGDIKKKIWLEPNMEYTARIDLKKKKKGKLRLFDYKPIGQSNAPNGSEQIIYRPNDQAPYSHSHGNGEVHVHHDNHDHPHPHPHDELWQDTVTQIEGNIQELKPMRCFVPAANIDALKKAIESASFATDKVKAAELGLQEICIDANQAVELVKLFSFESDRLTVAKMCYNRMTDKVNATKILDLFSYSATKEEYKKFIQY